jgi:hypothetical protein
MADEFEFISPTDQPALLGITQPQWLETVRSTLVDLGYKVHATSTHEDFLLRFHRTHYQVIILEETFAGNPLLENFALQTLQRLPMNQRRHAVCLVLGDSFETLDALQSFQQSVHAVVNPKDLDKIRSIIQQVVGDNDLFLQVFRDALLQISAWGK